jgi:glutamyl/glutaminyl-tRNA synthetase
MPNNLKKKQVRKFSGKDGSLVKSMVPAQVRTFLGTLAGNRDPITEKDFTADGVKNAVWKYAEEKGRGNVLWPLRVALTGEEKSPDPFMSAYILGKIEALKRIDFALSKLA